MRWAEQEWATADLGDRRLNRRLIKVAQQLADKPTASIPGACGGWADTAGAYRMLSNDSFDWRDVIEPHARCTMQRMSQESLVLCLQDTTELDFNGQRTDGLGPLSYEAQRDLYLLPAYAVSTQRESLCVLDAWMRALEPPDARGVRGGVTEATELIDWYRARWEVEIFFHVLKTGCRVEALQLASLPRIERALALFMVVSWRIAHLMRTGRTCPGLPASLLFGDGEPGVKTIWLGLQRVMDFAAGVRFMRESESGPSCV